MKVRNQAGLASMGVLAVLMLGQIPIVAQVPAAKEGEPASGKKSDPSRRVPAYFGKIGLSTEQRSSIYALQAKHMERIEALEKQVAEEKARMLTECEGVLTETQKKLLENLRRSAAEPATKAAN